MRDPVEPADAEVGQGALPAESADGLRADAPALPEGFGSERAQYLHGAASRLLDVSPEGGADVPERPGIAASHAESILIESPPASNTTA